MKKDKGFLNIATVFSGIGAPEQALLRLGVNFKIAFACDNGDRQIDVNYEQEFNQIKQLKSIESKIKYVEKLYCDHTNKHNFVMDSYLANYGHLLEYYFQDVKLLDGTDFENQIDLFVGGSPCQSFSIAGARGGFEDTRGTLFYEFARLVKEIQPKVFIYENVYGVLTHDKGKTWETMKNVFEELGYSFKWSILDARDYGIPQGRRRLFVCGFKSKEACERFEFPKKKELTKTMQYFLEENAAIGSIQNKRHELVNVDGKCGEPDEKYYLSPKLLAYCLSPGTKNFYHKDAEIDLKIARAILSTIGNSHRSSVNNYVTTHGRVRALTIREALRLMGFPDSYKIVVSKAQTYKQAGNSIVVDVLMCLIKKIFEATE